MTLRLRNTIMILLTIAAFAGFLMILQSLVRGGIIINEETLPKIISIVMLSLFSTIACIIIFFSFRNTASAEIFFFFVFIFSLIFDIVKLADFDLYGMTATRIIYYGRFLGTLALFFAGLFTTGLEYQKMGITAVILFLLPIALVLVLPVDITSIVAGGTCEIGRFHEIVTALSVLNLMAVLNFFIAWQKNESGDYLLIAAGIFLAEAGREIIYYTQGIILPSAGFLLLAGGIVIMGLKTHRLYLWD